jgi:hypothetical protein
VHCAGTTNWTANFSAVECLVDDLANGPSAAAALGAAAKATIDVARGAARRRNGGVSDFVIAQYVAGTDDHQTPLMGIR